MNLCEDETFEHALQKTNDWSPVKDYWETAYYDERDPIPWEVTCAFLQTQRGNNKGRFQRQNRWKITFIRRTDKAEMLIVEGRGNDITTIISHEDGAIFREKNNRILIERLIRARYKGPVTFNGEPWKWEQEE